MSLKRSPPEPRNDPNAPVARRRGGDARRVVSSPCERRLRMHPGVEAGPRPAHWLRRHGGAGSGKRHAHQPFAPRVRSSRSSLPPRVRFAGSDELGRSGRPDQPPGRSRRAGRLRRWRGLPLPHERGGRTPLRGGGHGCAGFARQRTCAVARGTARAEAHVHGPERRQGGGERGAVARAVAGGAGLRRVPDRRLGLLRGATSTPPPQPSAPWRARLLPGCRTPGRTCWREPR